MIRFSIFLLLKLLFSPYSLAGSHQFSELQFSFSQVACLKQSCTDYRMDIRHQHVTFTPLHVDAPIVQQTTLSAEQTKQLLSLIDGLSLTTKHSSVVPQDESCANYWKGRQSYRLVIGEFPESQYLDVYAGCKNIKDNIMAVVKFIKVVERQITQPLK